MRKLALTVALGAACMLAAPLVQRAEAGVLKPAPIGAALDETRLAEPVHCRPGRWHHSSGDGCRRVYRSYPRYYAYQQPYYAPYPYPYVYGYAPGIRFGFSVGPRRHWGW